MKRSRQLNWILLVRPLRKTAIPRAGEHCVRHVRKRSAFRSFCGRSARWPASCWCVACDDFEMRKRNADWNWRPVKGYGRPEIALSRRYLWPSIHSSLARYTQEVLTHIFHQSLLGRREHALCGHLWSCVPEMPAPGRYAFYNVCIVRSHLIVKPYRLVILGGCFA